MNEIVHQFIILLDFTVQLCLDKPCKWMSGFVLPDDLPFRIALYKYRALSISITPWIPPGSKFPNIELSQPY